MLQNLLNRGNSLGILPWHALWGVFSFGGCRLYLAAPVTLQLACSADINEAAQLRVLSSNEIACCFTMYTST